MWRIAAFALGFAGCYRGCNSGCNSNPPADKCFVSTDCDKGTSCREGYCISNEVIKRRDQCRNSDACAERGDCTLVYKRSFLGLDPGTECGATTDDECRASRACKERGACARVGTDDVGCGAATTQQCAESNRCATREECALDNFQCVRDWGTCPKLAVAGEPKWASPINLAWDYESLRAPRHPGDLASATLACGFEGDYRGDGVLRIAGSCTIGPTRGNHTLQADLPLHVGDTITAVIQQRAKGDSSDMFLQLKYTGDSPFNAKDSFGEIECVVVPRDLAVTRSKRELAAVDTLIATASREKPALSRPPSFSLDAARVHAERAAKWLGWSSPELAPRVTKLDATRVAYEKRLDAVIAAAPITTAPLTVGPYRVTLLGQVCGAALHARHGTADCALQLAIDNTSKLTQYPSVQLWWLRPAHDVAAATIDPANAIEATRTLAAGEHAVMLVDGFEPGAVLVGELDSHVFAIRSP